MGVTEPDSLLSSIDTFLRSCRAGAGDGGSHEYWQEHPHISAAELEMVSRLGCGSLDVEDLAQMLQRDTACTQRLLDALVAIGVLERDGDRYAATPAARLYCRAVAEGRVPEPE
jgi:hypothetical protein